MTNKREDANISWIRDCIQSYIDSSPHNTLGGAQPERAFDTPLVGFCRADDPLLTEYKSVIGPFHRTPLEVFTSAYPDAGVAASQLTVISWILPQTEKTKRENRSQDYYPAERWVRGRMFGEQTNDSLRRHVVDALLSRGIEAVAPVLTPGFESKVYAGSGWASTWSERHAAYAAGLGTFGLCDGLITPLGKAMRVGSVVARIQVPAVPRPYSDRNAYCLYLTGRGCGECIRRCPAGALGPGGHDKDRCHAHTQEACGLYIEEHYGFVGHGCGLCQTGVPCESGIPVP
jgi:epoxyqueuosine reductase QueG